MLSTRLSVGLLVVVVGCGQELETGNGRYASLASMCPAGLPVVEMAPGDHELIGTNAAECLVGTEGDDHIDGRGGDDVILGGGGNDELSGGNGADTIDGGPGNDLIIGGNGDDLIVGGDGNDILVGGNGADTMSGGDGNDLIESGRADDDSDGGNGFDACDGVDCEYNEGSGGACADDSDCANGSCITGVGICVYCQSDAECDDSNSCSADTCLPFQGCFSETLPDGAPCASGGATGTCSAGACQLPASDGYVFFSTQMPGDDRVELWAVPDTGGAVVQITDESHTAARYQSQIGNVRASWDGRQVAFASQRRADGSIGSGFDSHVWAIDADGSRPRYIGWMAGGASWGMGFFGLSWEGDNRHIVYADDPTCSSNILRADVETPGSSAVIYDVGHIAAEPSVNPTDSNDIVYANQHCAQMHTLRRLDVAAQSTSAMDAVRNSSGYHARFTVFSSDGTMLTHSYRRELYVYDGVDNRLVYMAPEGVAHAWATFGNDDTALYMGSCLEDTECRITSVDIATGAARDLGLSLPFDSRITNRGVSWARVPYDIDRDRDGLANGIDPTPDGP